MDWKRNCWIFLAVGLLGSSARAIDLVDTEADIFTSYLTTWPPEALDNDGDGQADIESYRSKDILNGAYKQVVAYPFYTNGLGTNVPSVSASYSTVGGRLSVALTGQNLKPNFAYQVKLIGKPERKWGTYDPITNPNGGDDLANERIGAGRWWCTVIDRSGDIVDAWNSNDSEYNSWKSRKFYDRRRKLTYWFEGYLLFDFVLTDANGTFSATATADKSYHVLWQTDSAGNAWNAHGYGPAQPIDTGNLKTTFVDRTNAAWYSGGTSANGWVGAEIEDTVLSLPDGDYPCFLAIAEESFHANLPPQYGPAYWEPNYGGCWMSAMCTPMVFSIGNVAPVVSISSPADGSSFDSGTSIAFAGFATDAEDGDLTASLVWTSDRDGQIGTGGSFSAVLSDGTHVITASVTDSGGRTGSDSIVVTVVGPVDTVVITAAFYDGKFLRVQATSSAAPDATLTVYNDDTGARYGNMHYAGGEDYTYKKKLKASEVPGAVRVESSAGGIATAPVA